MNSTALVSIQNVNKVYGSGNGAVQALKNVSVDIPRGAFLLLSGPSGSGKSTLLNLLGFLDSPTEGRIVYDGQPVVVRDFDKMARFRNRKVGFVFQSYNLIPVLSAWENVMVPLIIRDDLTQSEKKDRVNAVIAAVGLEDRKNQRPDQLSGGQKQRVAVARAMVTQAPIVLADEPTANLDTENSMRILELMVKMGADHGTAFIFSSHDPRVEKFAKQKVTLRDGEIVEKTL